MGNHCNDVCKQYQAFHNKGRYTTGRYSEGQKRCQECAIYLWWDGKYCPCCSTQLRTKPRNMGFKAKYRERVGITN